MLQFEIHKYNETQQAFPDPQHLKGCSSYVGFSRHFLLLFVLAILGMEVLHIQDSESTALKIKHLSYGEKKQIALST